jgi:hypothetical protein
VSTTIYKKGHPETRRPMTPHFTAQLSTYAYDGKPESKGIVDIKIVDHDNGYIKFSFVTSSGKKQHYLGFFKYDFNCALKAFDKLE